MCYGTQLRGRCKERQLPCFPRTSGTIAHHGNHCTLWYHVCTRTPSVHSEALCLPTCAGVPDQSPATRYPQRVPPNVCKDLAGRRSLTSGRSSFDADAPAVSRRRSSTPASPPLPPHLSTRTRPVEAGAHTKGMMGEGGRGRGRGKGRGRGRGRGRRREREWLH